MKFLSQESPPGSAALRQSHFNSDGWLRSFAQWFGVGLAHAAFLGMLLYASPPTLQMGMSNVIQAGLIAPRLLDATLETSFAERLSEKPPEKPKPPQKTPPPKIPEMPQALLVAASIGKDMPAPSYEVAEPSAESPQSSSAASASEGDSSSTLILPIFNADYLDNPKPSYPQLSRQHGETGHVLLRVYVSAKGHAEHVEIEVSSGFERLDTAARNAVYGWRFVPARRGTQHVAAWVKIPISFVM